MKARRSDNANACVEVMLDEDGRYHIRDSKAAPHGPVITVSGEEWVDLCAAAAQRGLTSLRTVRVVVDPGRAFRIEQQATTLDFTALEHECFVDGVQNAEFTTKALASA